MPSPFHGYGYGSWQTPGMWGGAAASRMGVFHNQSGVLSPQSAGDLRAKPMIQPFGGPAMGGTGKGTPPGWKGPAAGAFKGTGEQLEQATRRYLGNRRRQGGFQEAAGERYIGDITHQASGEIGPGNQRALEPGQPGALGTQRFSGSLPPGPFVMPSGPRPAGPAPTPLALPAQAGSAAPLGPSRRRGRAQTFGQMQFGGT